MAQHLSDAALKRKRAYSAAWAKQNTILISVQLNKEKDKDIIELLQRTPNRNKTIKDLLRKSLTSNNE